MSRLKIVYILSLLILVVLIASAVFPSMVNGGDYSKVQRAQLLKTEDQWIIEFHVFNSEGKDQDYAIIVEIDDKQYKESVLIPHGRIFTYIHHIYPDIVTEGNVSVAIYREGEDTPLEQATYFLE